MNVTDVPSPEFTGDLADYAHKIVERQSLLEDTYWKLENRPARHLFCTARNGQILIKDFLWRVTEEIGEALEAQSEGQDKLKIWEELADALHFVVGLGLITGFSSVFNHAYITWDNRTNDNQGVGKIARAVAYYVESAGILGNTLKMKPWKQTDVLTDPEQFRKLLEQFIVAFLDVARSFEMNPEMLYDFYWRKSEVNLFRIRSQY